MQKLTFWNVPNLISRKIWEAIWLHEIFSRFSCFERQNTFRNIWFHEILVLTQTVRSEELSITEKLVKLTGPKLIFWPFTKYFSFSHFQSCKILPFAFPLEIVFSSLDFKWCFLLNLFHVKLSWLLKVVTNGNLETNVIFDLAVTSYDSGEMASLFSSWTAGRYKSNQAKTNVFVWFSSAKVNQLSNNLGLFWASKEKFDSVDDFLAVIRSWDTFFHPVAFLTFYWRFYLSTSKKL